MRASAEPSRAPGARRRQRSSRRAGQNLVPGGNATAQMIDVAQVQGQVHAQSVHRVGELAERNPNETAVHYSSMAQRTRRVI